MKNEKTKKIEKTSRLSIDIEPELKRKFKELLPFWGMQRPVVNSLIKTVIKFFERYGLGRGLDAINRGNTELVIKHGEKNFEETNPKVH